MATKKTDTKKQVVNVKKDNKGYYQATIGSGNTKIKVDCSKKHLPEIIKWFL